MDDRLYRSRTDRMIAGVAGGLAERTLRPGSLAGAHRLGPGHPGALGGLLLPALTSSA